MAPVAYAAVLLGMALGCEGAENLMRLRSLKPGCVVGKRWMGVVPALPWGAWLQCGSTSFLITHPLNLVDHVHISTPEQALEYVRFFSNADSYDLFRLEGMVEIVPRRGLGEKRFNELDEEVFLKFFERAISKVLPEVQAPKEGREGEVCRGKQFEVKRVVLWPDQTVRKIVEVVCEDGFYNFVSQEVVLEDASKIGLLYFWPQ